MLKQAVYFCVIFLHLLVFAYARGPPNNALAKELLVTQKEKEAFQQFKDAVIKNITEPELVLMRTDLYLLRFIRSKNLDVNYAVREIFEYLKFIREENILNIVNEDWSDIEEDYHVDYNSTDKEVLFMTTANGWNIQRGLISFPHRLKRHHFKMVFEIYNRLVAYGKKDPTVTQCLVLFDLAGFNLQQHGCVQCILHYVHFLEQFERWVPGYMKEFILYNSPGPIRIVLRSVLPFFSPATREALKIFGFNKHTWEPYLAERIDKDQIERLYADDNDLEK